MNYRVYRFVCRPRQPLDEILVSELADLGFESFVNTPEGVDAYIPEPQNQNREVDNIVNHLNERFEVTYSTQSIPEQNWNARWEADYDPIRVGSKFGVRAAFHAPDTDVEHDLVINPQMSFGTGHHATTALMLELLGDMDLTGKSVLDMGCGTGVLAIAAMHCGAVRAVAVDIELRACDNTRENAQTNRVEVEVIHGGAEAVEPYAFDVILANINKNILKRDMGLYSKLLNSKGLFCLSGYFDTDIGELTTEAAKYNLTPRVEKTRERWAAIEFQRKSLHGA